MRFAWVARLLVVVSSSGAAACAAFGGMGSGGPEAASPAGAASNGTSASASAAASAARAEGAEAAEAHAEDEVGGLPGMPPPEAPGGASGPSVSDATTTATATLRAGGSRYASLDKAACEAELGRRRIGFDRVGEARGVVAPVRLTGRVGGIDFHSMLPASQRRTSPLEIYDCRLVLALDDFAKILARHDVVEVVHFSAYRPPPARFSGTGRRHAGALAIDAAIFKTSDGRSLSVEKDFHGRIGARPCPSDASPLRAIVCEAADAQLFNVLLTPDYNWQHRNHFHLEVTAGVRWQFVR